MSYSRSPHSDQWAKNCNNSSENGRVVAEYLISNKFLKSSNELLLKGILHLISQCLQLGVCSWSTSLVTRLHKKCDLYDPNNYKAVAIASNLGELFASILLERLSEGHTTQGVMPGRRQGNNGSGPLNPYQDMTLNTVPTFYVNYYLEIIISKYSSLNPSGWAILLKRWM